MLKKILIAVSFLIAAVFVIAALQPNEFHVSRSASFKAPPYLVFNQVNILKNWLEWSPWAKLDPQAKVSFEGPEMGNGAIYTWSGNSDVGEGKMTVVESESNVKIRLLLEFIKPYPAENQVEFTFKSEQGYTTVTWMMTGTRSYFEKVLNLLIRFDSMIGNDFEKGLYNMKQIVESEKPAHERR